MNRPTLFLLAAFALAWVLPGSAVADYRCAFCEHTYAGYAPHFYAESPQCPACYKQEFAGYHFLNAADETARIDPAPQPETPNQLTATLQHHLADGRLVFKNGIYEINDTLTTPAASGIAILGRGFDSKPKDSPRPNEAALSTGQGTRIRYVGPPGRPMIRLRGSEAVIDGLTLDCNGLATCGVLLDKTGVAGLHAPGKWHSSSLRVENATEAAIVCGLSPDHNHCDEIHVDYLHVRHCARVLLSRNHMAMAHDFRAIHVENSPIGFEYQGGGALSVGQLTYLQGETVLVINEHKKTDGKPTIGSGNWIFRVSNLKADAKTLGRLTLVDKQSETFFQATFDGGILPTGSAELIKAAGPCAITVAGFSGLSPKSLHATKDWRGRKPNIAINRSNLMLSAKTLADLLAEGAECHLSGAQNFDYYGTPIGTQ